MGCWVSGKIVLLTKRLMFQVLFFFIISSKILYKNPFNFFFFFFWKITVYTSMYLTEVKNKKFWVPQVQASNQLFLLFFSIYVSKKYLDHQTLGRWDNRPRDSMYYFEDCRIVSNGKSGGRERISLFKEFKRKNWGV